VLRVALCEDEKQQGKEGEELLLEYFSLRPELGGQAAVFSSAQELLEQVDKQGGFDIYLLDIIMPEKNGIELGAELRKRGFSPLIIYMTSSPDYAVDSYSVRAFNYLLKPVERKTLFSVLDEAVENLSWERDASIAVKTRGGLQRLKLSGLVYCELADRRICYYMSGGNVVEGVSLREPFRDAVSELLKYRQFALCSVSFAVNLAYVERIERERLRIKTGQYLPVSRKFREELTDRWMDFNLKGGAGLYL